MGFFWERSENETFFILLRINKKINLFINIINKKNMKSKLNESRVIVENGKIKTIYSEEIQNNGGWMTVEEARNLTIQEITKYKELLNQQSGS